MAEFSSFVTLSQARQFFLDGTAPGHSTLWRWYREHPEMGLTIGGRVFVRREVFMAIAKGTSIADAASIGAGRARAA